MSYLYSKKNWLAAIMAAWGYVVYYAFDKIDGRVDSYCQRLLMYISKPAFIYMAVLMLVTMYITLEFRASGCFELCFDVYGRRNCGYVFGLLGLNGFLSLLTFMIIQILCLKKYGFDKFFLGLIAQRVCLSYLLGGTFCILFGFTAAYWFKIKGAIVMALLLLVIASPKVYEMTCIGTNSYESMIIIQNFDMVQGHDGMISCVDIGNMKSYKWIKIIGMIAIVAATVVKLMVKKSRYIILVLIGCFICSEIYYYRIHDRSLEEFMNINQDIYYQKLKQSGKYDNQYYDFESPFVIESYDLDIKFTNCMNVKCDMKLSAADAGLDEYTFTLYHTLKIKKVTYNGEKISYRRDGDSITVGKLGDGVIGIEYYGFVDRNVANRSAVILSEAIPYYPVAGKRMVGSRIVIMNDYESLYRLNVNVTGMYTNLKKTGETTFEGRCMGPCMVKGLVNEMNIDGITVLVPKYSDEPMPDEETIKQNIGLFLNPEIKEEISFIGLGLHGYFDYIYNMPYNGYMMMPIISVSLDETEEEYVNNN